MTKFMKVERLTHLEKFQAIDRFHRVGKKAPVVRLYQYQKDALDKFMKKVLDCKGGTW